MILKASQRGGGKQLGLHLMRTDENEHVELHEIRGFESQDIVGAMKEAQAASCGTRCKQFLFSVSLSPPQTEYVPIQTFEDAIARIEERNNLAGQPRVVIFHEKEGRRHAHAVWSRIDAETMTARNHSHFKMKLRDLSREIYLEQGWKMPRGLMNSREADPRNFTLDQWQQSKRTGHDAKDLKTIMQECWAVSDSKAAFAQALRTRGFTLAKGDRRGHVAITPEGEVLSVARYTGKKTKDIRARLGKPDELPSVDEAQAQLAIDLRLTFKRHMREADAQKQQTLAPLETQRRSMVKAQRQERHQVKARLEQRWISETRARSQKFAKGLKGLWNALTRKSAEVQKQNEREAYQALARDRAQREALIHVQLKDRQALQMQITAARLRHAELLLSLRQEGKKIRDLGREPNATRAFDKKKEQRVKAKPIELQEDRSSKNAQEQKPLSACSPKSRLDSLRNTKRGPNPDRDKDFDRER